MLSVRIDSRQFQREINNIMEYSAGFLDGIQKGKIELYASLAPKISELASQFIDVNARMSPELLHHIYEWEKVGSPQARLFDLDYKISNIGITFTSSLKQSTSIKNGSNVPFYDKARIMEEGIPVTIVPKQAQALRFTDNDEEVFTKTPVTVFNPGGQTQEQFEQVFDNFFNKYFTQAFLRTSGIAAYLENPVAYKKNLDRGKRLGKSAGVSTGFKWMANAGVNKIG